MEKDLKVEAVVEAKAFVGVEEPQSVGVEEAE